MKNCYWQPTPPSVERRSPSSDSYDFIILGGGYSGMSAARFLKRRNSSYKILILEKDYVGFGASGRNGGFAMTLLGLNNAQLIRDQGLERAKEGHRFMKDCVQHVRDLIRDHSIDCESVDNGFMTAGLNSVHDRRVAHEVDCYRKLGTEVRHLNATELRDIYPSTTCFTSALWDPNCVIIHPYKLARALKPVTEASGVELCEGLAPASFRRSSTGYEVTLPEGRKLSCKKLIVTVNAYARSVGMFPAGLIPVHTYVVATEPLTPEQWRQVGWEKRNGIETAFRLVHHMRPTRDGRIVLGGKSARYYLGHDTRPEFDENEKLFNALREDLVKFFPALKGIRFTHAWGGPVSSTLSFFPTVGHSPDNPDLLWALGCCGHGVSLSNYTGKILADLIHGDRTADTELFFVNKKPWSLLPPEPIKYVAAGTYKNTMWWWDRLDEARAGSFF